MTKRVIGLAVFLAACGNGSGTPTPDDVQHTFTTAAPATTTTIFVATTDTPQVEVGDFPEFPEMDLPEPVRVLASGGTRRSSRSRLHPWSYCDGRRG